MAFHTYPVERADNLDDPSRYRYCSFEELFSALDVSATDTVLDLGVGTGFFSIDIAPHVDRLVGIDIQQPMLERLQDRADQPSVSPVTAAVEHLPIRSDSVDVAFSTMTFHEYATPVAHNAVSDVLTSDGRLITIDWTRNGTGESGPPLDERFSIDDAVSQLQATGYHVSRAEERTESFLLIARVR